MSRLPVMLSEAKHAWLLLWRTVEEMIRDSSPAVAGSERQEGNQIAQCDWPRFCK